MVSCICAAFNQAKGGGNHAHLPGILTYRRMFMENKRPGKIPWYARAIQWYFARAMLLYTTRANYLLRKQMHKEIDLPSQDRIKISCIGLFIAGWLRRIDLEHGSPKQYAQHNMTRVYMGLVLSRPNYPKGRTARIIKRHFKRFRRIYAITSDFTLDSTKVTSEFRTSMDWCRQTAYNQLKLMAEAIQSS